MEPFKSLNKINELKLNPGDKSFIRKWIGFDDQYLQIKNSGNIKACIEISNYGDRGTFRLSILMGKEFGIKIMENLYQIHGINIKVMCLALSY